MIHNQSKKGYFVTIISWLELVENLNNDFSMGQYDSMRVILRKLFQKMLNYILWLYFETCKVIMANYHTFGAEGEKVFLLRVS